MGTAFGLVAWATGLSWALPVLLTLAFFTIVLTMIDLDTMRLPDALTLPFAVIVVVTLLSQAGATGEWWALARAAIGAGALGLFYFAAIVLYPRGMGMGDVKLAFILGAVLGSFGWPQLAVGSFAAFVWGSLFGLGAMIVARRTSGLRIPFGPWMFAGAWTGLIVGPTIASWYLDVTGLS